MKRTSFLTNKFIICACLISLKSALYIKPAQAVINHAAIEKGHVNDAENFIENNFKVNGNFDALKASIFIDRLKDEFSHLQSDLYETKIIEKIELDIKSYKKAAKSAAKDRDAKKNALLSTYTSVLIPLAKEIKQEIENGEDVKVSGLIDRFIQYYVVYYLPNAPRNMYYQDRDVFTIIGNINGYKFKKKDPKKVEAFNLTPGSLLDDSKSCLESDTLTNQYIFNQVELKTLKECGLDLSLLEPTKNPFISNLSSVEKEKVKNLKEEIFPGKDTELTFDRMKYSSAGSAKLKAEYIDKNGKKQDVKIKFGTEVHTESASTMLSKMLGFNQDHVLYRGEVKLFLQEGDTVESFIAQWDRKYSGLRHDITNYLKSKSHPSEKRQWVILRDALLEAKDPERKRLESFHPWGWDFANRREHRAKVLWYAFLNMIDTKEGNHRAYLVDGVNGPEIKYSMQDVGYSLHVGVNLTKPLHMLKWANTWGVNTFAPDFLDFNKKSVHIRWAEIMLDKKMYDTTTFNDLKWLARKIAKLTHEDFKYAFAVSGFPKDIQDLYVHKLSMRRNQIIEAFGLKDEFNDFSVPNLKKYSPNKNVKNGEIVATHYEGHTNLEIPRFRFEPIIANVLSTLFSAEWVSNNVNAKIASSVSLDFEKFNKVLNPKGFNGFQFNGVKAGVKIDVKREIEYNKQLVNYEIGDSQAFTVRDTFSIALDMNSSIGKIISQKFPLFISGGTEIFKREYEHIHFSNDWIEGYKSPYKLLSLILKSRKNTAKSLKRGHVFKIQDSHAFRVNAGVRYDLGVFDFSVSGGYRVEKSRPLYLGRDAYGEFFLLDDDVVEKRRSLGVNLGSINLVVAEFPLLEFSRSKSKFQYKSKLYKLGLAGYNLDKNKYRLNETEDAVTLDNILNGDEESPEVLEKNVLNISGTGSVKSSNLEALIILNKSSDKGESNVTVVNQQGEKRSFNRFFQASNGFIGRDDIFPVFDNQNITVHSSEGSKLTIETDKDSPKKSIGLIEYSHYDRKLSTEKLLKKINTLNEQYSSSKQKPFFRELSKSIINEDLDYRKVYTHMRVYINIKKFLSGLDELSEVQLDDYFKSKFKTIQIKQGPRKRTVDRPEYRKFKNSLKYLKNKNYSEDSSQFGHHVGNILMILDIEEDGIKGFAKYFGKEALFVMGEIYGIHNSMSTMQQDEAVAGRRYAGESWGEYKRTPPIRKFLKDNQLNPLSIYAGDDSFIGNLFGNLPDVRAIEYL